MTIYYTGDIEKDLQKISNNEREFETSQILDIIGKHIGYGRTQQIIQVLWAKSLCDSGYPIAGALLPDDLEK